MKNKNENWYVIYDSIVASPLASIWESTLSWIVGVRFAALEKSVREIRNIYIF